MGVSQLLGLTEACANSGYQALLPRREGPGVEASDEY